MPATKLSKLEREDHLERVAKLHNRGWGYGRIASELGCSKAQVQYDVNQLCKRYKKLQEIEVAAHRAQLAEQYRDVLQEMWDAFDASKTKKVLTQEVVKEDGREIILPTVVELPVNPDVRFMQVVTDCLEAFRKLQGADLDKGAPVNITNQQQINWEPSPIQGVTDVDAKLKELEELPDKPQIGLKELPNGEAKKLQQGDTSDTASNE